MILEVLLLAACLGERPTVPELRPGVYLVMTGRDRGGAVVTREGDVWRMVSTINGKTLTGVGLVQDGSVSFALTDGNGIAVAVYRIGGGGMLYGRWTVPSGVVCEERLELLREFR